MPGIACIIAPGYPHHITQRGNNRAMVFLDDEDRQGGSSGLDLGQNVPSPDPEDRDPEDRIPCAPTPPSTWWPRLLGRATGVEPPG